MVVAEGAEFKARGANRIHCGTEATSNEKDGISDDHPTERVRFLHFYVTPPQNTLRVFLCRPSLN